MIHGYYFADWDKEVQESFLADVEALEDFYGDHTDDLELALSQLYDRYERDFG